MATRLKPLLSCSLLLLALAAPAQTNRPLSSIPATNVVNPADAILLNVYAGGTNWHARTLTWSNLTLAAAGALGTNSPGPSAPTNNAGLPLLLGTSGAPTWEPPAYGTSVGLGTLTHLNTALSQSARPLRIMSFGDSLSDIGTGGLLIGVISVLTNYLPLAGFDQGYFPYCYYTTNGALGNNWWTLQPDSYWWYQHFFLSNTCVATWLPLSGSGVMADTVTIKYVQEPGAGSFQILTSTNGGSTWNSNRTVNAAGPLLGVATNLSEYVGTARPFQVRVQGLGGGTLNRAVIIEAALVNSTGPGLVAEWWMAPGHGWYDFLAVPTNITYPLFAAAAPDLVLAKEIHGTVEMNAPTNMAALEAMFRAVGTNSDVVYIGHIPLSTNNPSFSDSPRRNGKMREQALANGHAYWDGYYNSPSYEALMTAGMTLLTSTNAGAVTDPHMNPVGGTYFGQMLWADIQRACFPLWYRPAPALAAGTNVSFSTNAGVVTVSATGGATANLVTTNDTRSLNLTNTANTLAGTYNGPLVVNTSNLAATVVIGGGAANLAVISFANTGDSTPSPTNFAFSGTVNAGNYQVDSVGINCPAGGARYGVYMMMGGFTNPIARWYYSGGLEVAKNGTKDPGYGGIAAVGVIQAEPGGWFAGNAVGLTNYPKWYEGGFLEDSVLASASTTYATISRGIYRNAMGSANYAYGQAVGGAAGFTASNVVINCYTGLGSGTNVVFTLYTNGVSVGTWGYNTPAVNTNWTIPYCPLTNGANWYWSVTPNAALPAYTHFDWTIKGSAY